MSSLLEDIQLVSERTRNSLDSEKGIESPVEINVQGDSHSPPSGMYRLYKRRFVGSAALVILNLVGGMPWPWFGPIADNVVDEFGFTLDQVNWLSNIVNVTFLPFSLLAPVLYARLGIKRSCVIGAVLFIMSAWIRYAGTARSLSPGGAYALIIIAQFLAGVAQPFFLVLGPRYSEKWFDLKSRTTATMVLGIANPVGGAIGQLISPLVGDTRQSILVLGIIVTVFSPLVFLVGDAPPTPPTYAAAQTSASFLSFLRSLFGRELSHKSTYMSRRERLDYFIICMLFGVFVGVVNAFSILTAQDFVPYGYSDDMAGLMGATLLLVGIVAAAVTSPLFDRIFTRHLALSCKIISPILAAAWLSLIWAATPHNTGALFAIMAIIGAGSLTLLPVALELAVELTRNADGSAAVLWFFGNLYGIIYVLAEGALRASPDADPPNNMHAALIFQGVSVCAVILLVLFLHGKQIRREMDENNGRDGGPTVVPHTDTRHSRQEER